MRTRIKVIVAGLVLLGLVAGFAASTDTSTVVTAGSLIWD